MQQKRIPGDNQLIMSSSLHMYLYHIGTKVIRKAFFILPKGMGWIAKCGADQDRKSPFLEVFLEYLGGFCVHIYDQFEVLIPSLQSMYLILGMYNNSVEYAIPKIGRAYI